jgi:sec-independent protein translocase protein TatC
MIGEYIEFLTRMLVAFGAVFEIPVVVFFLAVIGAVNHKQLIKFSRYFIVIAFVIAAIITPPDPMSQLLLAVRSASCTRYRSASATSSRRSRNP